MKVLMAMKSKQYVLRPKLRLGRHELNLLQKNQKEAEHPIIFSQTGAWEKDRRTSIGSSLSQRDTFGITQTN
jgi:hypothetical protein